MIEDTPFSYVTRTHWLCIGHDAIFFNNMIQSCYNSPGGGITTFDFMDRMFDGQMSKSFVALLMVSTVNGREFRIPSVSATSVSRDSLSSDFPCVERRDDSIVWADLICLSQIPTIWLAASGFLIHLTKSPPKLSMKE